MEFEIKPNVTNMNHYVGIPTFEEYYLMIAYLVSSRANCLSRACGAVLVTPDNKHIISTGYNGAPTGLHHCQTCRRRDLGYKSGEGLDKCRAIHAEQNAIDQLAKYGGSAKDSILYVTDTPCPECAKHIVTVGVKKIIFCGDYPNQEALDIFEEARIDVIQVDKTKIVEKLRLFADNIK
jgi:dCMP deaminase